MFSANLELITTLFCKTSIDVVSSLLPLLNFYCKSSFYTSASEEKAFESPSYLFHHRAMALALFHWQFRERRGGISGGGGWPFPLGTLPEGKKRGIFRAPSIFMLRHRHQRTADGLPINSLSSEDVMFTAKVLVATRDADVMWWSDG